MKLFLCLLLGVTALVSPARAYRVDEPFPLGLLDVQASLIVKATVLSSEPNRDELSGAPLKMKSAPYVSTSTRFKIISVLKGKLKPGDEFDFQHYAFELPFDGAWTYSPRHYNFGVGRSYLLWANSDGDGWKPFSPYDSSFSQQGALLASDDAPVEGAIREVVWNQIQGLLASQKTGDVTTGLRYLGRMRLRDAWTRETTGDYANDEVAEALRPFISSTDAAIATYAMRVAKFDAPRFASELLAASDSPEPRARAAALDALAGVTTPASEARVRAAVTDASPIVAAAALRSLSAFPGEETRATWKRWAGSDDFMRRIGVAQGIALAHDQEMSATLQSLTRDSDEKVSRAASTAWLRFGDRKTRFVNDF